MTDLEQQVRLLPRHRLALSLSLRMECGFAFEGCDLDIDGVDFTLELERWIVVVADG